MSESSNSTWKTEKIALAIGKKDVMTRRSTVRCIRKLHLLLNRPLNSLTYASLTVLLLLTLYEKVAISLSEFSPLVLLRAFSTQGKSKCVAVETFDFSALPLTAAVTLAAVGIGLHVDNEWKG